jgi:hypothetical protein
MKRKVLKVMIAASLLVFFAGAPVTVEGQCAMCKKSAENANSRNDTAIASTLNQGVL